MNIMYTEGGLIVQNKCTGEMEKRLRVIDAEVLFRFYCYSTLIILIFIMIKLLFVHVLFLCFFVSFIRL